MPSAQVTCTVCQQVHKVELTGAQSVPGRPFVFVCPAVDRRYRLTGFFIDSRRSFYHHEVGKRYADADTEHLRTEFGTKDFDAKFLRWKNIAYPPIGLIDEYPQKITEIINTYSMGYAYPTVTSCCSLAERILNRLVLRCREHFKSHGAYKKIYRKDSFDPGTLCSTSSRSGSSYQQRRLNCSES